jgi:hypothetical protein
MDGQRKAGKGEAGAFPKNAPAGAADSAISSPGGIAKGYKIESVEGIGPKNAEVLRKAGISRSHHLLERAATRKGRKEVAAATGLDEGRILKWTNMCDLMRIRRRGRGIFRIARSVWRGHRQGACAAQGWQSS